MFTSKGLFASIVCPHLESCVLPRCMFMHTRSITENGHQRLSGSEKISESEQQTSYSPRSAVEEESAPRKRRKLSNDTTSRPLATSKPLDKPVSASIKAAPSIRRTVSPPRPSRVVSKPTANPITISTVKPVARKAEILKDEQLNPRLLKTSPAPHARRLKLLEMFHGHLVRLNDELKKDANDEEERLILSEQQLIKMALDFEERTAVGKPTIYSQIVTNAIMMYKRMSIKEWKAARVAEMAHIQTNGNGQKKVLKPHPPGPIVTGLTPTQEHAFLQRLLTPIHHLTQYGYVVSVPTEAEVAGARSGVATAGGWEQCDRCTSRFRVFPGRREEDGALTSGESCVHHWGKLVFQEKDPLDKTAGRTKNFKCCGQSPGESAGCTIAPSHVFKISEPKRLAAILQFEETPIQSTEPHAEKPAICIDGEMGYTVFGLELIRLTATSWPEGREVLDVLVRPVGEVLDLNSRWSGVWPEQFANALPWDGLKDKTEPTKDADGRTVKSIPIVSSPAEARKLLYQHITPSTPIIGHGLENDLNALRLIHPTIIDTILLYPHRAGLPVRNGLKNLMMHHLGRSIQTANDLTKEDAIEGQGGHDSKEDAIAAGELVRLKIKTDWEKMKGVGWRIDSEGTLIEPVRS